MLALYRYLLKWIVLLDFVFAFVAWQITSFCRFYFLEKITSTNNFTLLGNYYWIAESVVLPIAWIILYYFLGDYNNLLLKGKFSEFNRLVRSTLIGCLIVFFLIFLNDIDSPFVDFAYYYVALVSFYIIQLCSVFVARVLFIRLMKRTLRESKLSFPILIISDKANPLDFLSKKNEQEIQNYEGYKIIGAISNQTHFDPEVYLGNMENLHCIIHQYKIQFVIVNLANKEAVFLTHCFNTLAPFRIELKILPDIIDIISGNVKQNDILGLDLIDVHLGIMPEWEYKLKRMVDILVSFSALCLLLPFLIYVAIRVRLSSKGNIFYRQERIGYKQMPFYIYKFRSMYINAEKVNEPQLAQDIDPRITSWGRKMRKWRIDELPQFWNVLKGDMSIIGPRPERKFFIQQLEENNIPFNSLILRVKPGISSLGMVRYGYASDIEQMKARIKYDLIYIENISILLDFRIAIATIRIVLQGKGK